MKLYYSPLSVYSAKPRIAMFEKAIAHETRQVNWTPATGWIKPEELARLNPKAQIPVLVDGETAISIRQSSLSTSMSACPSRRCFRPAWRSARDAGC